VELEGLQVAYIGLREFIQNKEAVGRARDLSDIKEIQANPKLKRGKGRKL
jgi:predicted nucleotidyltransferase